MSVLKYSACSWLLLIAATGFFLGGHWHWLAFLVTLVLAIGGDALFPPEREDMSTTEQRWLNGFLFATLPLLWLNTWLYVWHIAPTDLLHFGQSVEALTGYPLIQAKIQTSMVDKIGGFLGLGLIIATAGTNVAHELVHRTWQPLAVHWGRLLLAFTWDTTFAIEHVYGHHRNIATSHDPASARRGEISWSFMIRSTFHSFGRAFAFEHQRLKKAGRPVWSLANRALTGQLITAAYALFFVWALNSWLFGLIFFAGLAAYGKMYLELVNYIEHYGLARVPGQPVLPRHSWNSNHRISTLFLYNLTRHSHHHHRGHLPFWQLQAFPEAPSLPYGYLTMIFIAMIPPLFRKVMAPALAEWDRHHATAEELQLVQKQSA